MKVCRFLWVLLGLFLGFNAAQAAGETLRITTRDAMVHAFSVEMAITPDQQRRGLMFRTELAPDAGMLFDFHTPQTLAMWMKNTLIPLDMLFIDANGAIVFIAENTTPESTATISTPIPSRFVLELAGGTTKRLGLGVGDRVDWSSEPQKR